MLLGYISQASNIKTRENSPYTKENFLAFYPQFTDLLPEVVLDSFVAFMAGLIIFPACFAFGIEPGQGPSLIFITRGPVR